MKRVVHRENRDKLLAERLPTVGDQLDAIWKLLLSMDANKVQADSVYQRIMHIKSTLPKGGRK